MSTATTLPLRLTAFPGSGLVTQFYGHVRVTLAQRLQRAQAVAAALPIGQEGSGLDVVVPAPAGVGGVTGQEHRACRGAGEVGGVSRGVSWGQDGEERAVAEDVVHPFEFPVRVAGELKFLERGPAVQEVVIRPPGDQVQE